MITLWILFMSILCTTVQATVKPPLTINALRIWNVLDNTPIGSLVGQVSAQSQDDVIIYGLDHSNGFNIVQSGLEPLPFVINSETGFVYTNQSLSTWGGRDFVMDVTAQYNESNAIVSKFQVFVKIQKHTDKKNTATIDKNFPQSPVNFPQPPVNFPNYNIPPLDFPWRKPLTKLNSINDTSSASSTPESAVKKSTTSNTDGSSHLNSEQPPKTITDNGESSSSDLTVANKSKATETELIVSHEPNGGKLIIALIPTVVIFVSLFVSGVIVCLFRKKICKRRNKIKKDDMKKSSCSALSFQDSMVLQHWRSGRELSNRCDSWDSTNHIQVTNSTQGLDADSKLADKWEIPRHHIKVFNILGEGCFGQVWKCEALNIDDKEGLTVVAVKMLKENAGEQERSDLAQELHVMKMLEPHPNVVRLLGCCTEKDPIFVIMEYVPNGKLQSYLRHSRAQRYYDNMHGTSNTLTSRDLTAFCYQIAKGMQYLSSKGIIHRDLAARNILVGENHTCKVADFGFARDIMTSHVYERKSEGRLPIRWMAPESLYYNVFSVKSDIWSFGVLVWEIVTLGSTPYPGIPAAKVMSKVRDGYRLEKPEHCRRELYNIMYYCWNKDPNERPTFGEIVDLLEQLLLTETDYILLERFPDHSYYNMISLSDEKL